MEQQRAAYAVQGVDESEPAQAGKKRKKQTYVNGEDVRINVYSTHLPVKAFLLQRADVGSYEIGNRWSSKYQESKARPRTSGTQKHCCLRNLAPT